MAEAPLAENLKEDLTCPLCKHYSSHPVTLGCVHNVCRQCHLRDRREADQPCPCPDFRRTFEMIERDLEPDHHLGNLASIARNIRPYLLSLEEERVICERHQRKALLFCEHEQSLICASCSQSPEHSSHTVYTIKKAAKDSRDKLQKLSDLCHVEMEIVENMLCEERQKEKMWKEKGQAWRESIIAQYRRFHELLKKEEELHLLTFTQEETKKVKNVRENEVKLYQHLQRLREEMVDLEQKCQKSDLQLLQVVGDTLTRCESMLSHIPEVVTAPSTIFQNTLMWEMLKHFKVDIILDPESACPHLIVSDDLKTVLHGSYQQNYRFENCVILGIQVFTSGIHYWEVDVGEGSLWAVGVCKASLSRNNSTLDSPEDIFLLSCFRNGKAYTVMTIPDNLQQQIYLPIHKVGILLDYEEGALSFYDVLQKCFIYRFPKFHFSDSLRPIFFPCPPIEGKEMGIPMTLNP